MESDPKSKLNQWEVGQITEPLPAWELWEDGDGVEPDEEPPIAPKRERAA